MNNIFNHFISRSDDGDMKRTAYAGWFIESFPSSEFKGDERLFWEFMHYCVQLNVPIKRKYLDIWMSSELRKVLAKDNIRVVGCESLNMDEPVAFETAVQTTSAVLADDFTVLEKVPSALDDFKVEMSAYMTTKKSDRLTVALSDTYNKMSATNNSTEAANYALDTLNVINDLYNTDKLRDLDSTTDDVQKAKMKFVTDSGLPAIDTDSGGLFTKQLLGIEAQPGTGKTRFTIGTYCYRAVTKYKKNVLFVAQEQSIEEVKAMAIARHVFELFGIQISDSMIIRDTVPDELKPQVEAARIDLFDSGKYGKFHIVDEVLYVETFIDRLKTLDKLHGPFDVIAIDYMGLIDSIPAKYERTKTKNEIIPRSFELFKRYVRLSDKAGIAISQFNREGIAAGEADKKITTDMAQGGIAVYRNTDYNIAISMTEVMRAQQKRRFSQPKVRSSAGFGTFVADTRLGFCYFKQTANKEV